MLGPLTIVLSISEVDHYATLAIIILTLGLLTDIFDGIIARKLNVATQPLRRMDSAVDQLFFISVALATYIQCSSFFHANYFKIFLVLGLEAISYLISYVKFQKEIATHSIGAKLWTLVLFATLIEVIVQCESTVLFNLFFWFGLITRLEIMAIILVLKDWTNDIPTVYHAFQLRNGKTIKKHKLFNG